MNEPMNENNATAVGREAAGMNAAAMPGNAPARGNAPSAENQPAPAPSAAEAAGQPGPGPQGTPGYIPAPPGQNVGYCPPGAAPYPPRPVPRPKKQVPSYDLTRADVGMAAAVVVLAVFGVAASFWGGFRLGYALSYALTFLVYALYFRAERQKATLFAMLTGLLSFGSSAVFVLTSNSLIRFFAVFAMGIGGVTYLSSLSGSKRVDGDLGLLHTLADALGETLKNPIRSIRSLVSSGNGKISALSKVFLGLLISPPLLAVVVPLLMRADFAFEGLVKTLFSDLAVRLVQLFLGLLLVPFMLSFAFSSKYREERRPLPAKPKKGADTVLLASILSGLSAVYVLYLVSQFSYFFGEKPEGFSVAEYARRGFFEMCAIAALNFAGLYAVVLLSRKKENGRIPGVLSGLGTFIGLFTLLLTGTALMKMVLYIRSYGLTVLRLSTSVFMAFLAVVFVALILRLYLPKVNVLRTSLVTALLSLLVLGCGNVNKVVAEYNYNGWKTGALPTLDVEYLSRLGDEGVVVLVKVAKNADGELRGKAYLRLTSLLTEYYDVDVNAENEARVSHRTRSKFSQKSLPGSRAYEAWESLLSADSEVDFLDFWSIAEYADENGFLLDMEQEILTGVER